MSDWSISPLGFIFAIFVVSSATMLFWRGIDLFIRLTLGV